MKVVKPVKEETNMESIVSSYDSIRDREKVLKDQKTKLAETIKDDAYANGAKDDKGSYYVDGENFIWGLQVRKSISLNQKKAVDFLESNGFGDCVKRVVSKVVDEDALQEYLSDGTISQDELMSFTDYKETDTVYVKRKEEVPEVEQTHLRAAQRKSRK